MVVHMDDATRLIGDLHQKLADLDHKVAAYRQDMALEFHRYSQNLLRNLPHDIQAEVDRLVTASFHNYPALSPALTTPRDHTDSPPPPSILDTEFLPETTPDRRDPTPKPQPQPQSQSQSQSQQSPSSKPPPFVTSHAGTATLTSPDSAHDRERGRELHGLFTPTYLPLLDSAHPPAQTNHSPVLSPLSKPDTDDMMGRRNSGQGSDRSSVHVSMAATQTPERPNHERRATDDTTSSGTSEHSDSKVRRSALRRSSTGSKPPASPRRVRFEFEGTEVLPTASPQSSEPSLVQSHTLANSRSPPPPEDDSMSTESLLGPDEDLGPPPKKVSSTQALRALSRAPLDSNTVWTVVNPDAQGSDAETGNGSMATSDSESSLHVNNSTQPQANHQEVSRKAETERERTPEPSGSASPEPAEAARYDDDDSDDSSSDDGFLAMAKPRSFANKKAIMSPLSRSPTRKAPVPQSPSSETSQTGLKKATTTEPKRVVEEEDDEDMFHFEGLSAPPKPRARPAPIQEEEEEDDEDGTSEPATQTLYSTSPAMSIRKQAEPQIPAHLISGSVGSFRGRPVTMPVVKNPDVYQQAASLGDISSFIGGLDGRSGVDDGDLNSYRASVGQALFSGTPRSLTERMMMEEAQSQRRAAQRPQ